MSGQIRTIYASEPPFPATDQHPNAVRYQVGAVWVDAIGGQPTQQEIDALRTIYAGRQAPEARVTTIGTTPAELYRATLAPLTAYAAMVHLVGIDAGNGNMRYIRATLAAKRLANGALLVNDVGGTAARVLADHRDGAAGTWAITPSVSGNDFVITVVGATGRTVNWFVRVEVDSFTPAGL
jgi:hypothetical protein